MRGNRTIKHNAEDFEAFLSGNFPVLAEVGIHIRYNESAILKPNFKKLKVHKQLDTNIAILKMFPGINEKVIYSILNTPGLKGVILETYGSGNATNEHWFLELLRKAVEKEIIILNVTQCVEGSVEMGKYLTGLPLEKLGVLSGYDITTESAIAKMMYLFGAGFNNDDIRKLLMRPLRGEMTVRNTKKEV
jgi:L-asparaginase